MAGRLRFADLLTVVVPRTYWWQKKRSSTKTAGEDPSVGEGAAKLASEAGKSGLIVTVNQFAGASRAELVASIQLVFRAAGITEIAKGRKKVEGPPSVRLQELSALQRLLALASLLVWAGSYEPRKPQRLPPAEKGEEYAAALGKLLGKESGAPAFGKRLLELRDAMVQVERTDPLIYEVSLNRPAAPAFEVGSGGKGGCGEDAFQGRVQRPCLGDSRLGHREQSSGVF